MTPSLSYGGRNNTNVYKISGQCLYMTVGLNFGLNFADKWVGPMFVLSSQLVLSLKACQI